MTRISDVLADNKTHWLATNDILMRQRFMPGGRIQLSIGSKRKTTPYNCFVSGTIGDSFDDIMKKAHEAGATMRLGGGIGYDFSTLRPKKDLIKTLGSRSSGPVSFMGIFDAICKTIASAGHRRGAQMGMLRVDHPDIEEFIEAKQNATNLTAFNVSVAITDRFMIAVVNDQDFDLTFEGKVYKTIRARDLWEKIMRSTYEWAEPGVIFIDRINEMNNLWYCENIAATNPCAEQPLPPYGACLLGSVNLTKYVYRRDGHWTFDLNQFVADIPHIVRMMDNVVDAAIYPLPQQEQEAKNKRRMGLGYTGLANALEALGLPYGSPEFIDFEENMMSIFTNHCYQASAMLAKEKGSFPLYDERYLDGKFIKTLWPQTQALIRQHGIRNSHLVSIAPTGTISLCADNVSSGIEPVFLYDFDRTIETFEGPIVERVEDYGVRVFGVKGRTTKDLTADDHLNVLLAAQKYVDSAVSKTINIRPDMPWEEFKNIYMKAWKGGAKGCTTFNPAGKRMGILVEAHEEQKPAEGAACYIDPATGKKTCE